MTVKTGLSREQQIQRQNTIGSSEIAAICGYSAYKSALAVYRQKVEGHKLPFDNKIMGDFGNIIEDAHIEYLKSHNILNCKQAPNQTLIHPTHPHMSATLDGYVLNEDDEIEGVLELKQVGEYIWRDWPVKFSYFGKQIDLHISPIYYLQVMAQLAVTGLPYGIISILIVNSGGTIEDIAQVKIVRDEFIISKLEEMVSSFWTNHIEARVPPSLTTTEVHFTDDIDYLKSVNKEHTFASPNIEQMVIHMHGIKRQMDELKEEYDRMKCYVVEYMGASEELVDNNGVRIAFNRKQEGRTTYDHMELFKLNAALAKSIEKQGKPFYVFRLAKD